MGPEFYEAIVDLLDISLLLEGGGVRHPQLALDHQLEAQLVLNAQPHHSQQVLGVAVEVQVAVLTDVDVLEQSLAGVDLGLEVLALEEDFQEALRGIEAEHLRQVREGVVFVLVQIVLRVVPRRVEHLDDLRNGNAQVPDNFRSEVLLVVEFFNDHPNNRLDVLRKGVALDDLRVRIGGI